jgi:hypothetical protein
MTNGADSHSHVNRINQRYDNTVEVHVQTDSFTPGQEVEVSGYVIQGSGAYAAFNVKKYLPLDPNEPRELHVQLPAMDLNPEEDVTVVTRVAEIWPTVLGKEIDPRYVGKGLKATWTAEYPLGKWTGDPGSQSLGTNTPQQ